MQQYTAKNQLFLIGQNPNATDVRSFKEWTAAGRSVKKGEKALRVWVPKPYTKADQQREQDGQQPARFILGPVFDISQTEPTADYEARVAAKREAKADRRQRRAA
jgi:hypothetical protein